MSHPSRLYYYCLSLHRINTIAMWFGILVLTLICALLFPRTVSATPAVDLRASRTCIVSGETIRLRISTQGSLPATVTVLQKRLVKGEWHTVTPSIKHFTLSGKTRVFTLRPPRGRYRYTMIVKADDGIRMTRTAEFAVVSKKIVALTFDDGPWPVFTTEILQKLKAQNALGTFFMCGYTLRARPHIGKKVVSLGHEVGNHSSTHPVLTLRSTRSVKKQIAGTQKLIRRTLGVTPKWFRPPYGATSSRVRKIAKNYNLRHILWTVDTNDWRLRSSSTIASRVLKSVRPDSVVLMHDGGGSRRATVNALPTIIRTLKARGYDFVTLSELSALKRQR